MTITDVRVRKIAKEGKMKAIVSITVDDEFVVHDIKVIEGEKGMFIAMPSRKATEQAQCRWGIPRYRPSHQPGNPGKDPGNYFGSIQYGIGRTDCITS